MSRNGAGVYSLPAIYEAVAGETILATQHNTPLEDLEADMNVARPVVAGGTGATTAAAARPNLLGAGGSLPWAKGADVASAAALTLGSDGNYFDITGTTAITSIATIGVGTRALLQFDAALTLTHHATDLVLPGAGNITTAAGDHAEFVEYATGDWRCINYEKAAQPQVKFLQSGALTGANVDIVLTSYIALGYTRFRLDYSGFEPATDGSVLLVRTSVNAGSSFAATGYNSIYSTTNGTATGILLHSTGLMISHGIGNAAGERASGWCEIKCGTTHADMTGQAVGFAADGTVGATTFGGMITAANVDAFRLIPTAGNFDAGTYILRGIRDA